MKLSKKASLVLGGGVLTLALCALGYGRAVNTLPDLQIPSPTMPNPNACDIFTEAGKAIQDGKAIEEAVSNHSNANNPVNDSPSTRPSAKTKVYSLAEKEVLVAKNGLAVRLLRQGLPYPYLNPPYRSVETLFPYYSQFRGLARLLRLKGEVEAAKGDYDAAMQSWLDAMQMGEMIPHGSPLIGMLVGIACEAIGRRPVWEKGLDHLTSAQAKASIQRLEAIQAMRLPFADTVQEEKWGIQASLIEAFNRPDWRHKMQETTADKDNNGTIERWSGQIMLSFYGRGRILKNMTAYMDASIAQARQPYALHLAQPPIPSDPISQMIAPIFAQARIKEVESHTQNSLLLVALALRAYHEDKKAYPATLAELAPTYLKRLPDDPFALKGGFRYRKQGEKFVLYSVGPDAKDDGGKPIDDPTKAKGSSNPRARYLVEQGSLGDIVVGVNWH